MEELEARAVSLRGWQIGDQRVYAIEREDEMPEGVEDIRAGTLRLNEKELRALWLDIQTELVDRMFTTLDGMRTTT